MINNVIILKMFNKKFKLLFQILTSTVDHVAFVGFVQRPTVVLAVIQVVPTAHRTNTANTQLETTHTRAHTHTLVINDQEQRTDDS